MQGCRMLIANHTGQGFRQCGERAVEQCERHGHVCAHHVDYLIQHEDFHEVVEVPARKTGLDALLADVAKGERTTTWELFRGGKA